MHILISPNAFKNSLTASDAAGAIDNGLRASNLKNFTSEIFPVADGGDGTAQLITQLCEGQRFDTQAHDPLGKLITASAGIIENGDTAVLELASASGLKLLAPSVYNPMQATTYGTGELIKAALDRNVKRILIGVGGSATVDGGCGIAAALGIRFLDKTGNQINAAPHNFLQISSIDLSGLDKRIRQCEITVLCDVTNPLLGKNGAAAVFGPQKGADEKTVKDLEAALIHLSNVVEKQTGFKMAEMVHGGAAGGAAAGLNVFLNARLVPGIDHFLQITDFESALQKATLVITGEGSIDEQTLAGKAPYGVALRARSKGIPVIALAGMVPHEENKNLRQYFDVLLSIGHQPDRLADAMMKTERDLTRVATELGNLLALKMKG